MISSITKKQITDTILLILKCNKQSDLFMINLELRKCGIFITAEQLSTIIKQMTKDKLINAKENK